MKNIQQYLALAVLMFILVSGACVKDRDFPLPAATNGPGGKDSIVPGTLVVNEFMARGSIFYNELILPGNPNGGADWFEIYNTTNDTIEMKNGEWFVSDSIGEPQKYELPALSILPKSFQVVWCDGLDTVITQIHTNFSLSKDGEDLAIFYLPSGIDPIKIDSYTYGLQSSGVSFGRLPDGSSNWSSFNNPTPGTSNQ